MEGVFICIGCRRRKRVEDAEILGKFLGLCKRCNERLLYFPKKTVFPGSENIDSVISTFSYEGQIKDIIRRYKFSGQVAYKEVFIKAMLKNLSSYPLSKDFDLITAVPLSRKRFYERGYNQAELLAKPIAEDLGMESNFNCIFKKRHNKKQSLTGNKMERRDNVHDAYIADFSKIKGKRIILIDDVYTTGSTMEECAKELKDKGARAVLGVTLAKTVRYKKSFFGK